MRQLAIHLLFLLFATNRAGRKGNVRDALEFVFADGKSAAVSLSIPKGRKSRALRFYDAVSGAFKSTPSRWRRPRQRSDALPRLQPP